MKLARRAKPGVLLLLLLLILSACGDSPDDTTDPTTPGGGGGDVPPTSTQIGSINLITSSPQLPSSGQDSVTLTAFVRNADNVVMEGVEVAFAADNDGTLQVLRGTTDATGSAQALLSTPGNKSNRDITVRASVGTISESLIVRVAGTSISVSGPSSGMLGNTVNLSISLQDSTGIGVGNVALNAASSAGNAVGGNLTTNASGNATATITVTAPAGGGTDTITISGAGTSAVYPLNVTTDSFVLTTPTAATEVPLEQSIPVTVRWESAGIPVSGEVVTFSSTRGTLLPTSTTTNDQGEATVGISANNAGFATITATTLNGLTSQVEILFVATVADNMTLQANPAVIGTNVAGSDTEQSEIIAVIRDPNNNLVKNKTINFNLSDPTSGSISPSSAITDVYGRAKTTYTAGVSSSGSGTNGVEIRAVVADTPAVEQTVYLTTARRSLFITLGTGNELSKPDSTRYALPYGVMVTDSAGGPVANVELTLSIWPTYYYKGCYSKTDVGWEQRNVTAFPNEDVNRNGFLDPGEDHNDNGKLDPGNVATLSSNTITTDSEGYAEFNVLYFQQFAQWADVELTARTPVDGSEASAMVRFTLPILADDLSGDIPPAGQPSPFNEETDVCITEEP